MILFPTPHLTYICQWLPGKTGNETAEGWLPSWRHMLDTALVMQHLLFKWLPDSVQRRLQDDLSEDQVEQVAVLAALLHDIGKMTPLFVSGLLMKLPEIQSKLESCGLSVPKREAFNMPGKSPHALVGAAWLRKMNCPYSLSALIAAHHGKPADQNQSEMLEEEPYSYPQHLYGEYGRDSKEAPLWEEARTSWLEYALNCCGFSSLSDVPEISKAAQMILSGLLIMADWIASNQAYFPPLQAGETPVMETAAFRAERAFEALGLPGPLLCDRPVESPTDFQERFSLPGLPYPIQQAVLEIARNTVTPGLIIIEAQMGTGKTEAALAAAEQYLYKTGAGGIFFGLPTQATANGIFPRLLEWAKKLSEDYQQAIRLAHGMANMNEAYMTLPHGSAAQEDELIVHPWLESRKKALLANFVIGTVDQLLMAALKQKHVMLRHLGLAGKVVIIDECHAYDAYMSVYLERALNWLGAYHVPVILLSATLPLQKRRDLTEKYMGRECSGAWSTSREYPLITWTDGGEVFSRTVPQDDGRRIGIRIENAGRSEVPSRLNQLLHDGGCAVVILNTVVQAQQMAETLRSELPDKEILLVHSLYLLEDRAEWEKTLLRRLGKKSGPSERNGLIVVATQVVEQSLDIDADVMITELCPMDLLLQRLGRLHRHHRDRPAALQQAVCIVLHPESGSKKIYGEWLLQQTERLLPEEIILPDCIPELVQNTYEEPVGEMKKDPAWEKHRALLDKKQDKAKVFVLEKYRERAKAKNNTINGMLAADAPDDERCGDAAVRDGVSGIEVLMLVLYSDGQIGPVPWHEGGRRFSSSITPSTEEALCIARQRIRLPQAFCNNQDKTIEELEDITRRYVPEWQYAGLLHGELFLLLNENLQAQLGEWTVAYHQQDGLKYWKEGSDGTNGKRV